MPYDPDFDIYTAEPKLLSLDCFPVAVYFNPSHALPPSHPPPPEYDLIMSNTRYQRVSDQMTAATTRNSTDSLSHPSEDAGLLLLDPLGSDDGQDDDDGDDNHNNTPGSRKPHHNFTCNPTLFFRLLAICLLIPSFVLFVVSYRPRNLSATIFSMFAIVRNVLVILHFIFSRWLRIRIELRSRSGRGRSGVGGGREEFPSWLRTGPFSFVLDLTLFVVLLITTILVNQGAHDWNWRWRQGNLAIPACICSYIGNAFCFLSILDLGNPANITITGGVSFNYSWTGKKDDNAPIVPQFYHDVEAAGGSGTGMQTRKTGADSPVVVV